MKMRRINLFILVSIAAILILACGAGDKAQTADNTINEQEQSEAIQQPQDEEEPVSEDQPEQAEEEQPAEKVETEFPMLPDAENVMDLQGTITYQSKTSLADAFSFYRKELTSQGLKENEILTLDEDDMFQFVFEGSSNGKQLVVQTLKLDEKTINVTVRYEELNN